MSELDNIQTLYKNSGYFGTAQRIVFWVNTFIAISAIFVSRSVLEWLIWGQIVILILGVGLSVIDNGVFWYRAERARRRDSIQDAFSISLAVEHSTGYYSNEQKPSIEKYALNLFESALYSKSISMKMLLTSSIESFLALLVLIIVCRYAENINTVLIIAQSVFSVSVFENTIMLLIFCNRVNKVYDDFYMQFVTIGIGASNQIPILLSIAVEYEAIKAHYKVRLSEKVFRKHHDALLHEWDSLCQQI